MNRTITVPVGTRARVVRQRELEALEASGLLTFVRFVPDKDHPHYVVFVNGTSDDLSLTMQQALPYTVGFRDGITAVVAMLRSALAGSSGDAIDVLLPGLAAWLKEDSYATPPPDDPA